MPVWGGVRNIGNTCYAAAVLQALLSTPNVLRLALEVEAADDGVLRALGAIARSLPAGTDVDPREILGAVKQKREYFEPHLQGDAHEFFLLLLDVWDGSLKPVLRSSVRRWFKRHEGLNPEVYGFMDAAVTAWRANARSSSALADVMHAQVVAQITCQACGRMSHAFETVSHLLIDCLGTVSDAIDSFMRPHEELRDFVCERCKGTGTCTQSYWITRVPDVLIIVLKRFGNDARKTVSPVHFDAELDLAQYLVFCDAGRFTLQSVVCHHGCAASGHYTACITVDDQMLLCDDDVVHDGCPPSTSASGYMAVYVKKPI